MGLRKYQSVEKAQVLPPSEQKAISSNHRIGKTSAAKLSEEERRKVLDSDKRV
jgi:hypothetical protein